MFCDSGIRSGDVAFTHHQHKQNPDMERWGLSPRNMAAQAMRRWRGPDRTSVIEKQAENRVQRKSRRGEFEGQSAQ